MRVCDSCLAYPAWWVKRREFLEPPAARFDTVPPHEHCRERHGDGHQQDGPGQAARILAALPSKCRIVAMDERGRQWTTAKLANSITGWMRNGGDTAFLVGGADGLDANIKNSADEVLALSAMTLPHGLARILLAEQLYRAVSLINRHPYHRA